MRKSWNRLASFVICIVLSAVCVDGLTAAPPPKPVPVAGVLAAMPIPQSGGGHSVSLTWTASVDKAANPSLTYSVYRATPACTNTFSKINQNVSLAAYVDTNIQPGSYCYQVTSVLNGAESIPSNQAPAVILPAPPTAVTIGSAL